ncbi:chemotaxis protein CheB [Qipengyuania atrilutea]|uniref:PAS domain-containing protein n=1 Tax=Qipengyuania atrilutea TaxID=2744473 RepID=A0A850H5X4_9SPHN|nr:chemotaxis protein CheB [Actirhodobacter atriluteus]NVD44545.1 PAS domain-containing protein [Actirhodobacter atriluteus]
MTTPFPTVPVVGIGASAGGLEAIREVFQAYDGRTGLAFVIVQHLDPTHESLMAQLIERYTDMKVTQAEGGEALEADHIYVIPPGHGLAIEGGALQLTEFSDPRGQRRPIDDFFESLAQDRKQLSACVILSGTGADGSRGLRAIKELGGLAIAQEPETARYDGMPVSAISTGLVDVVAEPSDVIEALHSFFSRARDTDLDSEAGEVTDHIDDLCDVLRNAVGHDFSRYKRSTMTRRVARRMQVLSISDAQDYITRIRSDEDECQALFQDLLINVTQFFRDSDEFDALNQVAIDKLVKLSRDGQEIRIWVPGASSGEEAYSLAILFAEAMRRNETRPYVQIFATDIDDKMLDIARSANYPLSALGDIPIEYQHRYVIGNADTFTMVPQIRDMVRFSVHNLVRDPPFAKIDLISCRNLLIYFDDTLQKQVLPLFHFSLRDSGFLFLGTSEGIGRFEDLFDTVNQRAKIFRRKNVKSNYSLQIGRQTAPVYAKRRQRRQSSEDNGSTTKSPEIAALRRLAERYAPVSLLVDEEGVLIQKWGAAGKFLEFPDRMERHVHVPTLARPGLRETIGPMLRKVVDGQNRVITRDLEIVTEYGSIAVSVLCEPVSDSGYLIVIKETGALKPFENEDAEEFEAGDGQLQFLEEELQTTRHRLRSTVEELETTNEELKSSNEEMMSMNEELQSTNEELTTVNDELKTKVDQVVVANSDLKNFFDTTELMVLVVDANLCLRSFTDAAAEVFPIDDHDIGRPLSELSTRLEDKDYLKPARAAAAEGQTSEYRTRLNDGSSEYFARVIPYRRLDGTIDGATLIFTDVTEALRMEQELREERERLRLALEVSKVGIWEYEPSTDRTVLDAKERELFELEEEEGDEMGPILAKLPVEDRDRINSSLRLAMDGKRDFDETFRLPLKNGGERWLHGLGRRIVNGEKNKFIGVTYDITSERQLLEERELLLREMNHRVKNLFAVIAAMVALVRREADDLDEFAESLRSRIHALGRSHSLTSNSHTPDEGVQLSELIATVLEPAAANQNIAIEGQPVEVPVSRLTPLAMILYEWTTNASKYGALSVPDGQLTVNWSLEHGALAIDWREEGGSSAGDGAAGFGSKLVEVTTKQLNGEISGEKVDGGYRRALRFAL